MKNLLYGYIVRFRIYNGLYSSTGYLSVFIRVETRGCQNKIPGHTELSFLFYKELTFFQHKLFALQKYERFL